MKNKIPKTKREIDFFCDKILAEQQLVKLQLHIKVLNEVLKQNTLTPVKHDNS